MKTKRRLIRYTVKKFWGACAFLLISLAVFVVIGRELSPSLSQYKDQLSDYLSERLGVQVAIEEMLVDWRGLSPQVQLGAVQFINAAGETVFAADQALFKVNLLRSLLNRNLALDRLEAADVSIEVVQDAAGNWSFRGLPWQTTSEDNFNIDDPIDIFLLVGEIEFKDVQLWAEFYEGERNELNLATLAFDNSGDFHRLNSSFLVENQREVVSFILEFRGDPRNLSDFSAKGYMQFNQVNVEKVLAALPDTWVTNEQRWRNSVVTLESWFDIFAGGEILFRGRFDTSSGDSLASNEAGVKLPTAIGANFTGRLTAQDILAVSLRDMVIGWPTTQAPIVDLEITTSFANLDQSPPQIELRATGLAIAPWVNTLVDNGFVQGRAKEAVQTLQPQGQFHNLSLTVNPQRETFGFELAANFSELTINSWRGTPAVENLQGFLQINKANQTNAVGGEVIIDSEGALSVQFPTLYDKAMAFNTLTGQVNWLLDIGGEGFRVTSGLLSVTSDEGNARGYFDLSSPMDGSRGKEQLILQLGLGDTAIKHYGKYVPTRLPRSLLDWLEQSIGDEGLIADGGFLYRGGLVPEVRNQAEFQLFIDIDNTNLRYHPDFPVLENASGQLWMDNISVNGDIASGTVMGAKVEELVFDITGTQIENNRKLIIDGLLSGDASTGLAFMQTEAFARQVNNSFDTWQAEGPITVDLGLTIPLQNGNRDETNSEQQNVQNQTPQQITSDVSIQLSGVRLDIPELKTPLNNIVGRVDYNSQSQLSAQALQAEFLGQATRVDIGQDIVTKDLAIQAQGKNSLEKLSQWSGINIPSFIQGEAAFVADIAISAGETEMTITSDLVGTEIDLPPPYGKTATAVSDFSLHIPFGQFNTYVQLAYSDSVFGVFHINNNALRRGVISAQAEPTLPPANQFLIQGQIPALNFEPWRDVIQRHFSGADGEEGSATGNLPVAMNIQAEEFNLSGFSIEDINIQAAVGESGATFTLAAEKIAGAVQVNNGVKDQPIGINLDYLRLPETEQNPPSWSDIFFPPARARDALNDVDPSLLPPIDFAVEELFLGEDSLGAWSFNLRPLPNGLVANNVRARLPEGQVSGLQEEEGARLNWVKTETGTETRIEGKLYSSNLAALLEKWEQPPVLQSENANFDFSLRWPNTPTAISLASLRGELMVDLAQGSYYSGNDQSAGNAFFQLVSILNFDTWMRRLRLDFSDLGRGGLAYDNLDGLLRFDSGQVYLDEPLQMYTQSGEIQLTGLVDLDQNQVDMKLSATLPMGGNLTFLTALAAGLPAAAGVWVVSKIFDEQIDKVSTLSFVIDGPIQNPNAKFDRLLDKKPDNKQDAATVTNTQSSATN